MYLVYTPAVFIQYLPSGDARVYQCQAVTQRRTRGAQRAANARPSVNTAPPTPARLACLLFYNEAGSEERRSRLRSLSGPPLASVLTVPGQER